MNEAEWLTSGEPEELLAHQEDWSGRKLRLFAFACCERIDHLITDPRSRAALEFATRYVETSINRQRGHVKIEKAAQNAWRDLYGEMFRFTDHRSAACLVRSSAASAALATMNLNPIQCAKYVSSSACFAVAWGIMYEAQKSARGGDLPKETKAPEFAQQAHLLRDIFGNPFRPVAVDPAWLTSDVRALARGIYDEKAFDRMPILADALQDAGCDNDEVLSHCRGVAGGGSGEPTGGSLTQVAHVRGCWVVDLLLGKT